MRRADAEALYIFGAALCMVLLGLGFIELADDVREGDTLGLDLTVLHALRREGELSLPIGPAWLPAMMRDLTALGGYAVLTLITLIAAGFCLMMRRHHAALLVVVASLGGLLLNLFLKELFARARPDTALHLTEVSTSSFPSGHALLSAAIYLALAAIIAQLTTSRRARLYILGTALLLTGLVGISRVYLGVHYPTDVLGGWAVGISWAICCWLAMRAMMRLRR